MRHATTLWITLLASSLLLALGLTLSLVLFWPRVLQTWDSGRPVAAPQRGMPMQPAPLPRAEPQPRPAGAAPNDETDPIEEDWNDPAAEEEDMEIDPVDDEEDTTVQDEDV